MNRGVENSYITEQSNVVIRVLLFVVYVKTSVCMAALLLFLKFLVINISFSVFSKLCFLFKSTGVCLCL
jgi:hypothetical protein